MPFASSPSASGDRRLHQFGEAIREQRELAGLSIARLAEPLGYSVSAWARYETGGTIPRELPGKLDDALGTRGMFRTLWKMVKHERFPNRYRDYMRLEEDACEINEYAPYRIPGLLQTRAYARALFRAAKPEAPEYKIDAKVDDRLSRQERLQGDDAPFFSAVLDEAIIRRTVGGPAVMSEQLESLLPRLDRTGSRLQVAPFERGERGALG
ncbi:helix-turn-helix transcriptional regulator, partial [Streptomyces sp. SID3343]|uniref:helix-turn-helix domain-containing protein n=1 Tax=Streptomyces sp. SID3343 TaxID=2690260 RepID=UPI00136D9F27|nr:helix-turn-helix domain-containing protein [Streptomyces sp. SID3343]